jgi:tetratricopeptide (TPR) repeat protein
LGAEGDFNLNLRILIASLLIGVAAFAAETGAELFQKARTQEAAAGNLDEAIRLYQRVAAEFASDRPLAAKALVAEAQCYEKLGQDKAVKLYEQVVRDYRDQRAPAATANARLAALRQGQHGPLVEYRSAEVTWMGLVAGRLSVSPVPSAVWLTAAGTMLS